MEPRQFVTQSLQDARVLRILKAALESVEPGEAVRRSLREKALPRAGRTFALAVGKAALPMLEALAEAATIEDGLAITKHLPEGLNSSFRVLQGAHPVPDERSLAAGKAALEFAGRLPPDDLLVCLISGGGSALMSGSTIPLEELRRLTSALLASGARIDEINTLRRHLDAVKGGGLAAAAGGAQILSLILSDVMGDALEAIASGPTAPDPSGLEQARGVLQKYGLENEFGGLIPAMRETLKPGDPVFARVENRIIGSNSIALHAALRQAEAEGFEAQEITGSLQGEAREVGAAMARRLRLRAQGGAKPFCLVGGGETTVTLKGQGRGGRNQEIALAAVPLLDGMEGAMLISLATDGEDGPTDAAGAVATGESVRRAQTAGLDWRQFLEQNDSYEFFERLGDLIRTGPTGTNVNDLLVMVGM
jgi:hydroxypyruvate reductase